MFSGPEAFGDFVCAQKKDEEEDEDGGVDEGESATNRSPCLKKLLHQYHRRDISFSTNREAPTCLPSPASHFPFPNPESIDPGVEVPLPS